MPMTRPLLTGILLLTLASAARAEWRQLNGPDAAVATCMVMHDGVLLVGSHESDAGDVFRSTDGGVVWHNAHIPTNGANALLSHPSGIYLGTYIDGLYRSTDGGLTWQPVGGGFPPSADVEALAASGSAIFVASGQFGNAGIYASLDDGQTWGPLDNAPNISVVSLLTAGATVLAGTGGAGLHRSPDHGATWTPCAGIPANAAVSALGADGTTLYAGLSVVVNPAANGIYCSTNDGASWTKVSVDLPGAPLLVIRAIAPRDGALLAGLGGSGAHGLYRSVDGGVHWTEISATMPVDDEVLSLIATEDDLLVGFDQGVYRTADLGATWQFAGQGTAAIRGTGALWRHEGSLVVSLQAAGGLGMGVRVTDDAGATWQAATGIAMNTSPVAFAEQDGVLFAAVYGLDRGVLRSPDGGLTWTDASVGLPSNILLRALLAHDGVLLAGAWDGLFRSTDGQTWTQVPGVPNVQSLGVFDGALYAGLGDGGVRRSTDGGLTWPPVSAGLPAGNGVTSFAVHDGALYAGVWIGGVYRFDGVSWSRVGLPNAFVEDLHEVRGVLVAAEFDQVISVSTDGTTWAPLTAGFAGEYVRHLADDGVRLYAGTHGHGIWALPLDELPGGLTDVPTAAADDVRVVPNPFNPRTEVRFDLPADGVVTVAVYDVAGRRVRSLVHEECAAGPVVLTWDGQDDAGRGLPSGAYLVRVEHAGATTSRAVTLVR